MCIKHAKIKLTAHTSACAAFHRKIMAKKGIRYMASGNPKQSTAHMDKVIFTNEDLVWAIDAKAKHSAQSINIEMNRPASRRNTITPASRPHPKVR